MNRLWKYLIVISLVYLSDYLYERRVKVGIEAGIAVANTGIDSVGCD